MSEGWIKLHRNLLDNALMTRPRYLAVFMYILLSVNYKEANIILNDSPFTIHAGSGIFSQLKMSRQLRMPRRTLARALKYLESAHVIKIKATNKFTLIRATNWQSYQETDTDTAQQTRIKRAPNAQQTRTNKNDKNEKNKKNPQRDTKIFLDMVRWVSGMEGKIVHPKKYVEKIFATYPEKLIARCMQQSNCTSLMMFSRNMRQLEKAEATRTKK